MMNIKNWILISLILILCLKSNLTKNIEQQNIIEQFLVKDDNIEQSGLNKILDHFKSNGQEVSLFINDTLSEQEESEEFKKLSILVEEALELVKLGKYNEAFERLELYKEKAIELHHSTLLFHLGECHLYGEGTPKNEKAAFEILLKSAKLGNSKAQREVGFLYSTGRGVEQNIPLSLLYYTFSASAGDLQAAMSLAFKYKEGINVEKNCGKSLFYYKYVAAKVFKRIEETMLEERIKIKSIAKDVKSIVTSSDNEIDEDNDELLQLYIYNANNGDTKSQIAMGNLYLKGSSKIQRNFKKAFKYFSMAKEKPVAKGMLGFLYKNGYGVEQNNETAFNFFEEGEKMGDAYSIVSLGRTFLKGELGQTKDYVKALAYLNDGAKKGYALAHYYLGECSLYGLGVEKDLTKANQFYQISSTQVTFAQYKLALVNMMQLGDPMLACENSINSFKEISEKGAIGGLFEIAYYHYEKEMESFPEESQSLSSLYYEKLAEMGYESAQLNAAWIFHNYHHNAEKALKYYKWSATQHSALSHLQIGNYYYHGFFRDHNGVIITDKQTSPNMKKAFRSYQVAVSFNEPEALFNLGWMHQEGLGITKDKHLAKRYYDLSLVYLPSGLWAVKSALFYLQLLNFVEMYKDYEFMGYKWDSWLIVILLFILSTLILFKKMIQRIQLNQNQQNQQQNQQQNPINLDEQQQN